MVSKTVLRNALVEINDIFNDDAIFIGAVAVYAHLGRIHRDTEEIDVILLCGSDCLHRAVLDGRVFKAYEKGKTKYYVANVKVDFYIRGRIAELDFDEIADESIVLELFGVRIRVPSINHLLVLKLVGLRDNDIIDIATLYHEGKIDVQSFCEEYRRYCIVLKQVLAGQHA